MKISIRKGNKKIFQQSSRGIKKWRWKLRKNFKSKNFNSRRKNFFNKPSLGFYLIAEIGKVSAGQLMITYEWSDWRNGLFLWIQSVYVEPKFRNKKFFLIFINLLSAMRKKKRCLRNSTLC